MYADVMTSARPLRMGILGAARVARYALVWPARGFAQASIHAITSRDPARARRFAARFGIPKVHESYGALLADPDIDAVYVALPNSLHASWSMRALAAGKHVLCEKPLASNEREAREIARGARAAGRVFMEGMHYRHHPLAARMHELAAQLGRVRSIEIVNCFPVLSARDIRYQLALSGGAFMDLGSYAVNLLRFLVDGEPEVVAAEARLRGAGIDRWMRARLATPGGAAATLTCSLLSPCLLKSEVIVVGDRGRVRVLNPFVPQLFHRIDIDLDGKRSQERLPRGPGTYACQLRAFAAAIATGSSIVTTAEEGAGTMRTIDAIYRKAGLPVRGA
jgi:predicted dehydrogenase